MSFHDEDLILELTKIITYAVAETNGVSLNHTLELLSYENSILENPRLAKSLNEFRRLLAGLQEGQVDIATLLSHPCSKAFFNFFKQFPLHFYEEHIHLTGSLSADFLYPLIKKALTGKHKDYLCEKIKSVYGEDALPINSADDIDKMIRLKDGEQFKTYLRILYLSKIILVDRESHAQAAYHMAKELHTKYNVGSIRLKFTLSRATGIAEEQLPRIEDLKEEDVAMGLYEGFMRYKKEYPKFSFILSPSFRKEATFFDNKNFKTKGEHFTHQVNEILALISKFPELAEVLAEVDTVGDEKNLFRKAHFTEMQTGLRRLQYNGFRIRSHHGETWKTLRTGIQSVDNAMNIWHLDTLEHGLSLGINPNFYFHRLYQRIMEKNQNGRPLIKDSSEHNEVEDMLWNEEIIKDKLLRGIPLSDQEGLDFLKVKFHTAREIEHYQHDVLNRMIQKKVGLVALPSSNLKLTGQFPEYKNHPFTWWEKKGLDLGVGTDNYVTLNTNYINELLILLYGDAENLKITKLLMVATKETRRPYISHLLWQMKKRFQD